ncbi:MAG: NYN domain-containing protein, partial [Planctomycetota bacterium]
MLLLIDGYNLLHATDLFGAGELAGTLQGSREALVGFLAERLTEKERSATVVVFDAADTPPGLPDRYEHAGIDLRFARGYPDADSMIEEILGGFRKAKQLTVVSGDRRVQRAARSAGAKWIDSSPWFTELSRRQPNGADTSSAKPAGPIGSNADWIAEFADPAALKAIEREAAEAPLPPPKPPSVSRPVAKQPAAPTPKKKPKRRKRRPPLDEPIDKPKRGFGAGLDDLFPPGYAEDLLDD